MAEDVSMYNNPNGCLEVEEFVDIVHNNKFDDFIRNHKVTEDKCIPKELRDVSIPCFFCTECFGDAKVSIKEYKEHYIAGGKKIMKEDL